MAKKITIARGTPVSIANEARGNKVSVVYMEKRESAERRLGRFAPRRCTRIYIRAQFRASYLLPSRPTRVYTHIRIYQFNKLVRV